MINPTAPLASRFGPPPEPAGQATLANAPWLSTSTAPQFGNLGKNTDDRSRNQQLGSVALSHVRITERVTGQLRLETYNTFNHTQFNGRQLDLAVQYAGPAGQYGVYAAERQSPAAVRRVALRVMF